MSETSLSDSLYEPAPPRLSATVIVVRQSGGSAAVRNHVPDPQQASRFPAYPGDGAHSALPQNDGQGSGYEVLLAKRAQTLRVLPGFMVFPGGVLDEGDLDLARRWLENSSGHLRAQRTLPAVPDDFALNGGSVFARSVTRDELYYGLLASAFRELFEETGLRLLDSLSLSLGLQNNPGLSLGLPVSHDGAGSARVRYFGRRVTPLRVRYRFDTHYFAVAVPTDAGQDLQLAEAEFEMAIWATPQAILRARNAGSYLLAPPTVDALTALCSFNSTDTLLRHGGLPPQRDDDSRIDQFIAEMEKPHR